jgi:hypothetical protein
LLVVDVGASHLVVGVELTVLHADAVVDRLPKDDVAMVDCDVGHTQFGIWEEHYWMGLPKSSFSLFLCEHEWHHLQWWHCLETLERCLQCWVTGFLLIIGINLL